jgi:NADH-quinone oxidoreductase subunit G
MITLEIDGQAVQVESGSTVMDAATKAGVFVPHFCYHKKLSIAANCRMCLVQVEKAPKPLPACATPAAEGMKVHTRSDQAVAAQKGVMEFLLINHPLDCPICDQGGECQLQDLAVGYGGSSSRYQEEKRVVTTKPLGPLVSADEMSRCIHCTRCVRFGQEVAGVMELGMAGRGEHSEILSFVGRSVDSELSGNMIDVCPVGALTSKPFRYSARTWELSRRKSIAPHDGLGSNIVVQVKNDRVMRVLPLENEAINECWLSDRDRFSYEALNSDRRLTRPMLRSGDTWRETDWQTALKFVADELQRVARENGASAIGALVAPTQTLEELYLLQKLVRALGSENIDFRTRQSDFRLDGKHRGANWLGCEVADLTALDTTFLIGTTLRHEQPLLAHRFRQAARKGQQVALLHVVDDDLLMPVAARCVVKPSLLVAELAGVVKAVAEIKSAHITKHVHDRVQAASVSDRARTIARVLTAGNKTGIFLGHFATLHPEYALLRLLAQELAHLTHATVGFLSAAANTVGAQVVHALPGAGGLNAQAMLRAARRAYLLFGVEPLRDLLAGDGALAEAELVVQCTAFRPDAPTHAHVLLPIAPWTETPGTFVSMAGRVQSFHAVTKAQGDARPGWKVLRVLATLLGLKDFAFEHIEDVRRAIAPDLQAHVAARLSNAVDPVTLAVQTAAAGDGLERILEVPLYHGDSIVRHAASLSHTRAARDAALLRASAKTLADAGLIHGQRVAITGEAGRAVTLVTAVDRAVPEGAVRVSFGVGETAALGGALTLRLEAATEQVAA